MTKIQLVSALSLCLAGCGQSADDAALSAVAYDLKDPESAKFRELKPSSSFLCGEINSKNSYGAYVGFRRFIYDRKSNETLHEPPPAENPTAVDIINGCPKVFSAIAEEEAKAVRNG